MLVYAFSLVKSFCLRCKASSMCRPVGPCGMRCFAAAVRLSGLHADALGITFPAFRTIAPNTCSILNHILNHVRFPFFSHEDKKRSLCLFTLTNRLFLKG